MPSLKRVKQWLSTEPSALPPAERARLAVTLAASRQLQNIYAMREELSALWSRSTESSEQLLVRLQDWCHRAEMSGIDSLARFSLHAEALRVARCSTFAHAKRPADRRAFY